LKTPNYRRCPILCFPLRLLSSWPVRAANGRRLTTHMPRPETSKNGLADPSRLAPVDDKDSDIFQVIIETPKGSRNKYAYDQEERIFALKKVLPSGMAFPYDFGFIPSTKAEDGDPIDVLVLMDEPAFPGCLLKCRPIGVIEGEQGKKGDKERNDRIVAIEQSNHRWAHVKHIDDLGKQFVRELEEFFVNYHELMEKKYKIIDVRGPREACRRIEDCRRRANGKKG
jgi:inorganic pyrophosphatase